MRTGYLYLLIVILLLSRQLSSQNITLDSLIETVNVMKGQEKIDACAELSFRYFRIDPAKGIYFGHKALILADSLKLPAAKSKAWNSLGANYFAMGNQDSARISFHKALHYATAHNDTIELATAFNRLGVFYEKKGAFDSALIVFHKALVQYAQLENFERTGLVNENIGNIHLHRGELKTALVFLLEAESAFKRIGNKSNLASVYLKIGRVYSETGEYETAEKWYQKGKLIAIEAGDFHTAGVAINAMGIMYKNQNRLEEALTNYLEIIEMGEKINSTRLLFAAYNNIGIVYYDLGEYKKALDYHQRALIFAKALNNPVLLAEQYVNTAIAYNALEDYSHALSLFEQALPVFISSGSWPSLLATYQGLITANNGLKDYSRSVDYYEKFISVKDSLNRNELNTALDSMKVKFNTEQTMIENTLLSQQNELHEKTIALQRTAMFSAILFTLLLLGFIAVVVRSRQKVKKANRLLALKNEEISAKAEELELKNKQLLEYAQYKDSMNSFLVHDLKNPLNAIINLDSANLTGHQAEGIKQSGRQMLTIVSNLLDISKHENNRINLTIEDLSLAGVIHQAFGETDYLAKQKSIKMALGFLNDFVVKADQEIFKRVFVNIFTNAIKFSQTGGAIRIFAEQQADMQLKIMVKDEGEGISPEYLPFVFNKFSQEIPRNSGYSVSTGIGLTFCKMAVETLGGTIGVISEKGSGATFWFTIPLSHSASPFPASDLELSFDTDSGTNLNLTADEKNYLKPFCIKLENLSVYEITDVKKIVHSVEERSENLINWKSLFLQALSACNEQKYKELTCICNDKSLQDTDC